MRMVYTNENRLIVSNAKNILKVYGFNIYVKNEHAASAIGEVSAFDSWLEIWVVDDEDYDKACKVLEDALSQDNAQPWICDHCTEENDASFELCWNCGTQPD